MDRMYSVFYLTMELSSLFQVIYAQIHVSIDQLFQNQAQELCNDKCTAAGYNNSNCFVSDNSASAWSKCECQQIANNQVIKYDLNDPGFNERLYDNIVHKRNEKCCNGKSCSPQNAATDCAEWILLSDYLESTRPSYEHAKTQNIMN